MTASAWVLWVGRSALYGAPPLAAALLLAGPTRRKAWRTQLVDRLITPMYIAAEKYVAAQNIPAVDPSTNLLTIDQYLGESSADGRGQESFDHSKWDALLKAHVKAGRDFGAVRGSSAVDYTALAADSRFREYLSELAGADVEALMPTEQLALFLNAYNALCVSVIVGALGARTAVHTAAHTAARAAARDGSQGPTQASPLASINDLTTTERGPVWDQVAGVVGGRPYTLNEIEHRELRGKWGEPTIHSCIVCASASCPDLRPEAFRGEPAMLRAAMDEQFRGWMANPTKGERRRRGEEGRRGEEEKRGEEGRRREEGENIVCLLCCGCVVTCSV